MEIKTLKRAADYSPDKVIELLLLIYIGSDSHHKLIIDSYFDFLFNNGECDHTSNKD